MTHFVSGNRVELLQNGAAYFPALEAACDRARSEIFLESYIFEADESGERIAAALKRAAASGVMVHVLVDGFGSRLIPGAFVDDMRAAGVQFLIFRPKISPWSLHRHRLRRMHRKIALIDMQIAFVGGINIIDDMDTPGHTPPRYDYAVSIEGPLLVEIRAAVRRLWTLASWTHFRQHWLPPHDVPPPAPAASGKIHAAFVVRDNLRHRRSIEEAYLRAIEHAKTEIVIANAYFLPGMNFRHALADAAARGVRVVLLLQGRVEYLLLHYATRALYGSLLDTGVEIYEYHKSFMHAKVAVIDGHWATVGSSNIDPFSLLLSREANVLVRDAGFAANLRQSLEGAMQDGARVVTQDIWKHQSWRWRFLSWLSYGGVRFLMGMAGYAREDSQRRRNGAAPRE